MTTLFNSTRTTVAPMASTALFVVWGGANDFLAPRRLMPETRSKPQTAASRTCWPSSLHYRASERSNSGSGNS